MTDRPSRADFEEYLYDEVALLDEWRLDEWFALFAEGATYHVPTAGAPTDADPAKSLFYIADDYIRLRERIERLKKKDAHVEYPRSSLRHMISRGLGYIVVETQVSLKASASTLWRCADLGGP